MNKNNIDCKYVDSDESGDDEPALRATPDFGAIEQHPANAFFGHRLLLRSALGVHALPRSQPPQYVERRMGI